MEESYIVTCFPHTQKNKPEKKLKVNEQKRFKL